MEENEDETEADSRAAETVGVGFYSI